MTKQSEPAFDEVLREDGLFSRAYNGLTHTLGVVLALLLAMMSVLISYQVISRYFFNAPSSLTEELLRYSLIWLGILGSAYCFMLNKHLNLPLLVDALSPRRAGRLNAFNAALTFLFGALLAWGGYHSMIGNALTLTPMLHVAVGTLQSVLLIAGLLICLSQLVVLAMLIRSGQTRVVDVVFVIALITAFIFLASVFREPTLI
nr:TRAP transporter small permease [Marinicella sp. W31]MDC2875556.1 TRAP transporter small permease [Marinicella sp. W31]